MTSIPLRPRATGHLPGGRTARVALRVEASLPSGLFWRFHDPARPFTEDDATSTPIWNDQGRPAQKGYSALPDPWVLYTYGFRMGWVSDAWVNDDDVIGFRGRVAGTGVDDEPLVIPEGPPVYRKPFDTWVHDLARTPLPDELPWGASRMEAWNPWYMFADDALRRRRNPAEVALAEAVERGDISPFVPGLSSERKEELWGEPLPEHLRRWAGQW